MKKYKYIGDGMGVPGLPHEISDELAETLAVTELLKAALENGSYEEVQEETQPDPLTSQDELPEITGWDVIPPKPEHVALLLGEEGNETSAEESPSELPAETSFEDEKRPSKKRKE
jgi:hypothetical protein